MPLYKLPGNMNLQSTNSCAPHLGQEEKFKGNMSKVHGFSFIRQCNYMKQYENCNFSFGEQKSQVQGTYTVFAILDSAKE